MRESVHVFKLQMLDLTVGHLRFLHEIESPFVDPLHEEQNVTDLLLGALVCSMTWQDARKHVGRWYLKPLMRFWAWRCRKCNPVYEAAYFRTYLSNALEAPKVKKANGGKSLKSPLHQRLYLMLVEDLNHPPQDAWDFPVRDAVDLWMTRAEKQGALEFWSDRELGHFELHKEMEKRWQAEQEARAE